MCQGDNRGLQGTDKKMKIAIDGYEANTLQRLGSSQLAFELIKHLEKIDHKNNYEIFLPDPPMTDLPKPRDGWMYKILRPKKLWTQIALPLALYMTKQKAELIFSPTHYIPRFSPVKRIATIFDLSFLHFPQMFEGGDLWKLKNWTKFSVNNADWIVTISNFSKQDIVKQYGVDKNKITVAYPGFNQEIFHPISDEKKIKKVSKKYGTGDNYLISIGTIQPRKNLVRLIEASSRIDNLSLVVVGKTKGEGKGGWMFEDILDTPKRLGVERRVKFLGFVPREDLPYLLSDAVGLIQPSLWEGFGMPVLEAMACGVPVIVSNVSSLPEIVGDAGFLIDPYSLDQIEEAIRILVTDKKLREKYAKASLIQAQKFSWDKMAKLLLKTFEKVASKV